MVIANSVVGTTAQNSGINTTITAGAVNASVELAGRELIGTAVVTNATGGEVLNSANFTVSTGFGSDGLRSVVVTTNDGAEESGYSSTPLNVSYDYNPNGYLSLGGARAINNLVLIFAALAIVVFVIVVLFQPGSSLSNLIRNGVSKR